MLVIKMTFYEAVRETENEITDLESAVLLSETQGFEVAGNITELKAVFEKGRIEYEIVRAVMGGETTFHQEYEKTVGKYRSWRAFTPRLLSKEFEKEVADLVACIGESYMIDRPGESYMIGRPIVDDSIFMNTAGNTVGMGSISAGVVLAALGYLTRKIQMNRRTFLECAGFVSLAAVIGGGIGSIGTIVTLKNVGRVGENAKYLDGMHAKLYKG